MGKLLESLKSYFEETPQNIQDRDWEEIKGLNEYGPDVTEYAERVKAYFGLTPDFFPREMPILNKQEFETGDKYYLAA